ncbi:MAG: ATP-binding protein [Verrucomicrobiota bacterium]
MLCCILGEWPFTNRGGRRSRQLLLNNPVKLVKIAGFLQLSQFTTRKRGWCFPRRARQWYWQSHCSTWVENKPLWFKVWSLKFGSHSNIIRAWFWPDIIVVKRKTLQFPVPGFPPLLEKLVRYPKPIATKSSQWLSANLLRKRFAFLVVLSLLFSWESMALAVSNDVLQISTITVSGNRIDPPFASEVNLGAFPGETIFYFRPVEKPEHQPMRMRCQLDGHEQVWHEGGGEMYFIVRFYNEAGDNIDQIKYTVRGASPGWTGSLQTSPLAHRRETIVVPTNSSRVMVVLSSAGPPATIGVYVVQGLTISKRGVNPSDPESIVMAPLLEPIEGNLDEAPKRWERDGTRPTMAKVVEVGEDRTRGFAIIDDDPLGHAEWHNIKSIAPRVMPNDRLVIEWNEMFSMGVSDFREQAYHQLEAGSYRFRLSELSVFGMPVGQELMVNVRVALPYWRTSWFWSVTFVVVTLAFVGAFRYYSWRRVQQAVAKLQQQHALEQERLRIAQDIHDDLGARITQISIVSGMAQKDGTVSDKARTEFDRISMMSRDLVSALYETVWAVNPENDNVEAVGSYLCQRINELCVQAGLRCRLNVSSLPRNVEISSRARHNLSMVANEAVHNVIKHANATLVTVKITFEDSVLMVVIADNGCGFPKEVVATRGYGLTNMHRRMSDIGGTCEVKNGVGNGTSIQLQLDFKTAPKTGRVSTEPKKSN